MPTATALDALLADVRAELPGLRVLTDVGDRESYRLDETAYLAAGLPGAVGAADRHGRGRRRCCGSRRAIASPVVPRGAGTGLSGGAAGIEGALTIALTRMNRSSRSIADNLCVVTQPGVINADLKAAVAQGGAVLSARPRELRDVLDRRQPGHQRRRAVLRQVRPDARLGPRAGGRARRRDGDPHRRPDGQGHRRLLADAPVRRLAGHARDHHRGDAPAPAAARAAGDAARVLRERSARPATRWRR